VESSIAMCYIINKRITYVLTYASAGYWKHFTARFDDVHAIGYNSTESEPIWVKSRAL